MTSTIQEQEAFIEEMKTKKPREVWLELWEARKKLSTVEPVSTELTPEDEAEEAYRAGKTVRYLEYGVEHPNGVISWSESFELERYRENFLFEWENHLRRAHVKIEEIERPRFVTRVKQFSFSSNSYLA